MTTEVEKLIERLRESATKARKYDSCAERLMQDEAADMLEKLAQEKELLEKLVTAYRKTLQSMLDY